MQYRNTKTIISAQGVEIEPGFLWEQKNDIMVLVDNDQYVTSTNLEDFDPV